MAQERFFALGTFGAHAPCGTCFAEIGPALVFPVAVPVCGGIMQCMVLRANHIVKVFIIHICPPGMALLFGLGAGIAGGKNAAALKNAFAYPRRFVGAVCHHRFVFGVVLA